MRSTGHTLGMPDLSELRRFVEEHLTAASVMVALAPPIPRGMSAHSARAHLKAKGYDLALFDDEELRVVTLTRLARLKRDDLIRPASEFAETPRRSRLIARTLPLREVVRKLRADPEPLLVVGDSGVTHLVTIADFGGVAGTVASLSFLMAVDQGLNELLLQRPDETLFALTPTQERDADERRKQAEARGAELHLIDYLSMGTRLAVVRRLKLNLEFDLGTKDEHDLLLSVRNDAAHRTLSDPQQALVAIESAERILERLPEALARRGRPGP